MPSLGAGPNRDIRVCFVGDSFVAGVGDSTGLGWTGRVVAAAAAAGVQLTGYNLGIRRQTSRQIADRLPIELPPRLDGQSNPRVVISFGVNDCTMLNEGTMVDGTVLNDGSAIGDGSAVGEGSALNESSAVGEGSALNESAVVGEGSAVGELIAVSDGTAMGVCATESKLGSGTQRVSPAQTHLAVLDAIAAVGRIPLLFVGPPPVADEITNQRIEVANGIIRSACAAAAVPYLATFEALRCNDIWRAEVAIGDGAHPDSAGYAELFSLIGQDLLAWLREPAKTF